MYPDSTALESPTTCHSPFFFSLKTQKEIEHPWTKQQIFARQEGSSDIFQFGTKQNTYIFHHFIEKNSCDGSSLQPQSLLSFLVQNFEVLIRSIYGHFLISWLKSQDISLP